MLVKTKELPEYLYKKLPISLQLSDEFDSVLIKDKILRREIENYISGAPNSTKPQSPEKILDITLEQHSKGLGQITDPVDFLIFNVRNFFSIKEGNYPFDPQFGTRIYEYVKVLDGAQLKQQIYNEIDEFLTNLITQNDLNLSYTIDEINITKKRGKELPEVIYEVSARLTIKNLETNQEEEIYIANEFKL